MKTTLASYFKESKIVKEIGEILIMIIYQQKTITFPFISTVNMYRNISAIDSEEIMLITSFNLIIFYNRKNNIKYYNKIYFII